MKDEHHEADELSELIDRVVLHDAEAAGVESGLDGETVALVSDLRAMARATPMREEFARELEGRLGAQPAAQTSRWWSPLAWRHWATEKISDLRGDMTMKKGFALTAIAALVLVVGIVIAIPPTRAVLAEWLGFGFKQQETLPPPMVKVLDRAPWDMPGDASFEMFTIEIPKERWELIERAEGDGFSTPQPGTRIPLPNGNALPVPGYLPEGYRCQGVMALQGDLMALGFFPLGSQSGAGGGSPLPPYDRDVINYLIGGNRANRLLLLSQLKGDLDQGLLFQAYHVVSPAKQPPAAVEDVTSDSPPGIVPTPTPVPSFYAAKTQVGLVIQPAEEREGLVFLVGPSELHETTVGESAAWWYRGTWNAAGKWVEDGTINLIWEQDRLTYQLTGQELALAELVRIAESLPPAP